MHIDEYEFGRVIIGGIEYTNDVMIVAGKVEPNWWRRGGHTVSTEDLKHVIAVRPDVLIVGCGAYGAMKVPEQTRQALHQQGIKLEALNTYNAVERFNELSGEGIAVAAALHLTC
jgi:hypothetical protein